MKILALDLSTKTGWSYLLDGKIISYGLVVSKIEGDETSSNYPQNYIDMAKHLANQLKDIYYRIEPDFVVIEETNKGKNRFSQKCLEFIHYAVNDVLKIKVHYVDTSEWRHLLDISLSKDDRSANKEVLCARKEMFDKIYNEEYTMYYPVFIVNVARFDKKRDRNKEEKKFQKEITERTKIRMRSFRFKKEGKVTGKIGQKTLSVNFVNEYFNLVFKKKDNDITDSICLGLAFIKKLEAQG